MKTYEIPLKISLQVKAKNSDGAVRIALREQQLLTNKYKDIEEIYSISSTPLKAYMPLIDWFVKD